MKERPIIFSTPMVQAILKDVNRLWLEGMTNVEIAKQLRCSTYPVVQALKILGLKRPANRRAGKGVGHLNPSWKGGERQRKDGYWLIWTPEGERLKHRVVMESYLGRKLSKNEIVHHIDGDNTNNNIDNLELMNQSQHAKLHNPEMHKARYGK